MKRCNPPNANANANAKNANAHDCSQLAGCTYVVREKNMYICESTGNVHVCDNECIERYVNRDSTATCKISGRCFQQMHHEHPFGRVEQMVDVTPYVPKRQKKTTRTRNPFKTDAVTMRDYLKQAKIIIHELFFSQHRRDLDRLKQKQLKRNVNKRIKKYMKGCKKHKKCAKRTDIDTILRSEHVLSGRRVGILEENPEQVIHYAEIIVQLWMSMSKTPYAHQHKSHMHYKNHILGTLYMLQYGFCMDDTTILPKDDFLYKQLPSIHDMKSYKFNKKGITIGKNAIVNCIRSLPSQFIHL